jgi:3-methylfumaryl-CoA hydratase
VLDELKSHVGRTQMATDMLHVQPANLLRLALGRPEPELREGDPLPPGWLSLYFLPRFTGAELRPDGSPRDTGVVPPMPLPRRMFAGERVRLHRPLRLRRRRRGGRGRAADSLSGRGQIGRAKPGATT